MDMETAEAVKKEYELAFLLTSEETLDFLLAALKKHTITPSYQSPVNQIRLAYPIQKNDSAFFGFFHFEALPETILKVKNELALNAGLIRFLIVTPPSRLPAREKRIIQRTPESKPSEPVEALSNEALEQKLEEILK